MIVVVQRVIRAEVRVADREPARIGKGLLLLAGLARGDTEVQAAWMAKKIASLRVFPNEAGRLDRGLAEVEGRCLVVSQFTLLGDARHGRRPDFSRALEPSAARELFDRFTALLAAEVGPVATGVFGAPMEVELVNDGPFTLVLERPGVPEEHAS